MRKITAFITAIVCLFLFASCRRNYKIIDNTSARISDIYYNDLLTEYMHAEGAGYFYEIPRYNLPPSKDGMGEYFYSKETFNYLKLNVQNYRCYNISIAINNNSNCDIWGYKYQLEKDFGTAIVLDNPFDICSFDEYLEGENSGNGLIVYVDMTQISEEEVENVLANLPILFSYERVIYPMKKIDDYFGAMSDPKYMGTNTIDVAPLEYDTISDSDTIF